MADNTQKVNYVESRCDAHAVFCWTFLDHLVLNSGCLKFDPKAQALLESLCQYLYDTYVDNSYLGINGDIVEEKWVTIYNSPAEVLPCK